MSNPLNVLENILTADRVIHEPVRLCIMTVLNALSSADFVYLQKTLDLTGGNLSTHVGKLVDADYVVVEKSFVDNRSRTRLALTAAGLKAYDQYITAMRGLLA